MPWGLLSSGVESSSGSWGNSGWSSSDHGGGHGSIGFGGFGSSGWGSCDRPDNPCPLGTHLNKCIACNTTRWSNRGLMRSHYNETCPGCRRERSLRANGAEQFGGYLNADVTTGVMLLGTLYAHAQKEDEEVTQVKTPEFLGSEKHRNNRLVPLVASRSLWHDTLGNPPSSTKEEAPVVDGNMDLSLTKQSNGATDDRITSLPSSNGCANGNISLIKVKGFKSLWSSLTKKRLTPSLFGARDVKPRLCAQISLWGARDNRPKLCAKTSLFGKVF